MHSNRVKGMVSKPLIVLACWFLATSLYASPCVDQMDSTDCQSPNRMCLAAGVNQGIETDEPTNGILTFGFNFTPIRRFAIPFELAVWGFKNEGQSRPILRLSVSAEYNISILKGLSLAPKVGGGLLFALPVVTINFGCRIYCSVLSGLMMFMETGTLLWFRESQRRSNHVTSPAYFLVGAAI
jgi:hypothetical protein